MSTSGLFRRTLRTIKDYGLRPSRRLGQSYVIDPGLINTIIGAAELRGDETVLEIGAGTGNLTLAIAERAGKVIAVEKDPIAARSLRDLFAGREEVEVINEDILLMGLPPVDKVISNLPYSISTPITFRLLEGGDFKRAILTYQREVAERLLAKPGTREYSRLSVASALLARVNRVGDFPPESFYPRPLVWSTVLTLEKKAAPEGLDQRFMDETLKLLFSQRKRKLKRALEAYAKIKGLRPQLVLGGFGESLLERRVFQLSPPDFVEVGTRLKASIGQ